MFDNKDDESAKKGEKNNLKKIKPDYIYFAVYDGHGTSGKEAS